MKIKHVELVLALILCGVFILVTASLGSNGGDAPVSDARVNYLPPPEPAVQKFVIITSGKEVYLDGSNSFDPDGSIAEYQWDFGDGVTGPGETVSHVYVSGGEYYANLTVMDNDGNPSVIPSTVKVIVNPTLRAEILSPKDSSGILNITENVIEFRGRAIGGTPRYDYPYYDYLWESDINGIIGDTAEFDMGVTSLDIGDHHITLTVTDALGDSATDSIDISIITELKAEIMNMERYNCSTVKTFSDGSGVKVLEFPPLGGSNSDAKITLSMDARICDARLDVEVICSPREGGDVLIYDFGNGEYSQHSDLISLLEGEGYAVNHHIREGIDITDELLQAYGQAWFIDSTNGMVITDSEIDAIESYVSIGGNILLSGGSNDYVRNVDAIAERFDTSMTGGLETCTIGCIDAEFNAGYPIGGDVTLSSDSKCDSVEYFGHAFTATDTVGGGNYIEEVKGYSNLIHIECDTEDVTECANSDIQKIEQAAAHDMKSLLTVIHILYDFSDSPLSFDLHSNYEERWNKYASKIRPYADDIVGFYIMDEPYWLAIRLGMPFAEMKNKLETAASLVKSSFPDKKVLGGFAVTEDDLLGDTFLGYPVPANALEEYGIPVNYDWVAVYYYYSQWGTDGTITEHNQVFENKYLKNHKKYMRDGQRLVVIPGAFYFTYEPVEESKLETLADYYYYNLSRREPKIVAIVPFLYPSTGNMVGVIELNDLKSKYMEIGREIVSHSGATVDWGGGDVIITSTNPGFQEVCDYVPGTDPANSPCAGVLETGSGRIVFDSSFLRFIDEGWLGDTGELNINACDNSQYAIGIAGWLEGTPVLPPITCGGETKDADIAICFDTTASMGTSIQSMKDNVNTFADSLESEGVDYMLGLVDYRDVGDASCGIVSSHDFTNDVDEFKSWVDDMSAYGGDDNPEQAFQAIEEAMGFSYRGGDFQKVIILITDADSHEPACSGNSIDDVMDTLKNDGFTVYAITDCSISGYPVYQQMAIETGGKCYPMGSDLGPILADIARLLHGVFVGVNASLDIGSDGIEEWNESFYSARISDWNTDPPITEKLNDILNSGCVCPGCSLSPSGLHCTIDLEFTTDSEMPLILSDLSIVYCYGACPDCVINWTGQASGGRPPYEVRWISMDDGVIDRYWIEDNPGNYTLVTTPPMVPPLSEGRHNIVFEVEDSLGNRAFDIEYETFVYWCCTHNASCTTYWPGKEGPVINTGNDNSHSCDIYEVCHPDLQHMMKEAIECCKSGCSKDCHDKCNEAYSYGQDIGLEEGGISISNPGSLDGLKRCAGLYLVYGFGPTARFMSDYFWPEICCTAYYWPGLIPFCLSECCVQDIGKCSCSFHLYSRNAFTLQCSLDFGDSPPGWNSDVAMNKNTCFFSDLQAHANTLGDEGIVTEAQGINTGTCCDYSNSLNTALRIIGYDYDEVYSTVGPGHCYNLVKFPGYDKFHLVDTTGNTETPWGEYTIPPTGYPYCIYYSGINCRNDRGIFECPPKSEVYGC